MDIEETIEKAIEEHGDLPASVIAEKVVAQLEEEADRRALNKWLLGNLETIVAFNVRRIQTARRAAARDDSPTPQSRFRDAAGAAESGDKELLAAFLKYNDTTVVADGTEKHVVDFTGEDHRFVAERYQQRGKTALMLAAFHRQVAKKVGSGRTGDKLDKAAYEALHASLVEKMK